MVNIWERAPAAAPSDNSAAVDSTGDLAPGGALEVRRLI